MSAGPGQDAPLPRVLLVEDDASIRRFVTMALDETAITLLAAATLAEARAELDRAPVRLLLCDLMLPDGSGLDLLHDLVARPDWRAGARLVAFSAGVTTGRRAELLGLGVDEVLAKPVALAELEACVQRALAATVVPTTGAPADARQQAQEQAVQRFFGGNAELFAAYRQSCLLQFATDLQQGDAAAAHADLPALRRLAHSLKTVLLTLGDLPGSERAAEAERQAAQGAEAAALQAWAALRQHLPGA
ncbi:response regulator transcription factor [Rubrivivax sp. RP6-9]|uniref:response regulator transcription factor n=1 Tax=Rubrivivax sp. RP6-9 TaxID=3415750 RepID=UPI003CC65339